MSTNNKFILITGCSSGIGLCLAQGLLQRGYQVIACCRKPDDTKTLSEQGLIAITLDLADSESVQQGAKQALEIAGGAIYGLINNGAYGQYGAVEDLTRKLLREQLETNVFGTQELTNLILPAMRQNNQGRVIQISSLCGLLCIKFHGAYSASKYALEALTDTMRVELHHTNIKFSLIEPGAIRSQCITNALVRFRQTIDQENTHFKHEYQSLVSRLESKPIPFSLPATAILTPVIHALENRKFVIQWVSVQKY